MALTWADSADRHNIAHEDALHAIANAIFVDEAFEEPRPPATIPPALYIGPQRDPRAPLLEVMVELRPPRSLRVFHVMHARDKHLARMEQR